MDMAHVCRAAAWKDTERTKRPQKVLRIETSGYAVRAMLQAGCTLRHLA
jgi:hypothetical protein